MQAIQGLSRAGFVSSLVSPVFKTPVAHVPRAPFEPAGEVDGSVHVPISQLLASIVPFDA
jgi:hypothetical protein